MNFAVLPQMKGTKMTKDYNIPEFAARVAAYSRKPRLSKAARERLLARFREDETEHQSEEMGTVVALRLKSARALPVANDTVAPEIGVAAKTSDIDTETTKGKTEGSIENDAQLRPLLFSLDLEGDTQVKLFADFSANAVFAKVHHIDETKDCGEGQLSQNKIIEIGQHILELDFVDETQALYRIRDTSVTKIFAILHQASEK